MENSKKVYDTILDKLNGKVDESNSLPYYEEAETQVSFKSPTAMKMFDLLNELDLNLYKQKNLSFKHLQLFKLMCLWVEIKQKGLSFEAYFKERKYNRIGIYGMHYVGNCLCEELQSTDVEIAYTMDKNVKCSREYKHYTSFEHLEEVDAIIVTPITYFDSIKSELNKVVSCPIISIEYIIKDMLSI